MVVIARGNTSLLASGRANTSPSNRTRHRPWDLSLRRMLRSLDDCCAEVLCSGFSAKIMQLFNLRSAQDVAAEKAVSFDNGLDGSIAEDCFFAMRAYSEGYSFNFIEGEMWEKSPFTLWDFMQQRKRWIQGILLVVHSNKIPIKNKLLLGCSCYSWLTLPLSISNLYLASKFPIPCPPLIDFLCAFIGAVNIYMFVFGVIKSFTVYRFGLARFMLCVCGAVLVIPFNLIIENVAVIWGIFGKKHKFYVVNKTTGPAITV